MRDDIKLSAPIKFDVGGFKWEGDVSTVTHINADKMEDEMSRQPGLVSWFSLAEVEAFERVERLRNKLAAAKDARELAAAKAELNIREGKNAEGTGPNECAVKITEGSVAAMVTSCAPYQKEVSKISQLRDELADALHLANKISKIMLALEHKKDMLVQMSANRRREVLTGGYADQEPFDGSGRPLNADKDE
jgi:hypothetical protein